MQQERLAALFKIHGSTHEHYTTTARTGTGIYIGKLIVSNYVAVSINNRLQDFSDFLYIGQHG